MPILTDLSPYATDARLSVRRVGTHFCVVSD